ncbi:MAG TPA: hypothetical protein VF717_06550 [Pyrinomonadaceae bacterium]|jgi:hypothetical protein
MKNQEQPEKIVNVTFQLKGADAEDFLNYMEREFIRINSVAGQKLALERLREVKQQWSEEPTAQVA